MSENKSPDPLVADIRWLGTESVLLLCRKCEYRQVTNIELLSDSLPLGLEQNRGLRISDQCIVIFPQQCLYFLPDPHGHGSLRPTFGVRRRNVAFEVKPALRIRLRFSKYR
jgi:hypothetical protein